MAADRPDMPAPPIDPMTLPLLEGLTAQACIIAPDGRIVATIGSWERFGQDNGGLPGRTGAVVNDLEVCRRAAARRVTGPGRHPNPLHARPGGRRP